MHQNPNFVEAFMQMFANDYLSKSFIQEQDQIGNENSKNTEKHEIADYHLYTG